MANACGMLQRVGQCLTDPLEIFDQAPDDAIAYRLDASLWLQPGDTLTDPVVITVPAPLLLGDGNNDHPAPALTSTVITFWLFGGTLGHEYAVNVRYTTTLGRTRTKSFLLQIIY